MTDRPRHALWALFLGASAIAFAPLLVRLSELGPSATAFHRLFLALPALWLWASWPAPDGPAARKPATLSDSGQLVLAGLFFAADLAVWHWSIKLTTVANATLFANFAPLFVALAGWLFFHEQFSKTFLAGLILGIAGAAVLISKSFALSSTYLTGDALGILTAVFYAGYILSVARLRQRFPTATIMVYSGAACCLALWPVAWISGESLVATTLHGWMVLIALALISQAAGQSMIAYALAHLPASFGSVALLWQPVMAALLAWVMLNEPLGLWQLAGAVLVLAGIYLARQGSQVVP